MATVDLGQRVTGKEPEKPRPGPVSLSKKDKIGISHRLRVVAQHERQCNEDTTYADDELGALHVVLAEQLDWGADRKKIEQVQRWLSETDPVTPLVSDILHMGRKLSLRADFLLFAKEPMYVGPCALPTENDNARFRDNLAIVLRQFEMPETEFADLISADVRTVRGWLSEEAKTPTVDSLIRIGRAVDVSADYLLWGTGEIVLFGIGHMRFGTGWSRSAFVEEFRKQLVAEFMSRGIAPELVEDIVGAGDEFWRMIISAMTAGLKEWQDVAGRMDRLQRRSVETHATIAQKAIQRETIAALLVAEQRSYEPAAPVEAPAASPGTSDAIAEARERLAQGQPLVDSQEEPATPATEEAST